ncbi:MAG TPA: hypothetical protein VKB52_15070 [Rhodanobacteraceae bacterium]|nr:hypothetical protein [Rhodanobacteraceae bacterium]
MTPKQRRIVHVLGLAVFAGIAVYAFYRAPPDVSRLKVQWLVFAVVLAGIAMLCQGLQNVAFLRQENAPAKLGWAIWFASEKAWLNSVFPAKAGTAGAIVVLHKKLGIRWDRYVRFMLLCSGTTAVASLAALAVMLLPTVAGIAAAIGIFVVCTAALVFVYKMTWPRLYALGILSVANLAVLSGGVGACLIGLGYPVGIRDIAPIGVVMNLLSIVAITPGNFGVREATLSLLAPVMPLGFSVIIQGSTCYVFSRLLASLGLATALRGYALAD